MDAFWKTFNKVKCSALNIGYVNWLWVSVSKEISAIIHGSYFSYLFVKYYPNERPLGEFAIAKAQKIAEESKQEVVNKRMESKQEFAQSIHNSIQKILNAYVKKGAKDGFNPRDFQESMGYTLSMRKDINRVRVKKITRIGQNAIRVSIDIFPEGWDKDSKMSFSFDFRGDSMQGE